MKKFYFEKIFLCFFIIPLALSMGQTLSVGDILPSGVSVPWCENNGPLAQFDSLYFDDYNGAINDRSEYYVIWLMMFTSWCGFCQAEAPITQEFYEMYQDSGLVVMGSGTDWGQPYECDEWATQFSLTYPIVDDEIYDGVGNVVWDFFGEGFVPHNVVINHNMEVIYSSAGFDEDSEIFDVLVEALDDCGILCKGLCSFITGDIDGTQNANDDNPTINVMDLLRLSDIVESGVGLNNCIAITGDVTNDGLVNIIDVYALANLLVDGNVYN